MSVNKILYILLYFASFSSIGYAQNNAGVYTKESNALLQIDAFDIYKPSEFTGFSVPVYNKFSNKEPSKDQNGMLMYFDNKENQVSGKDGFYYWNDRIKGWEYIVQYKYSNIDLAKTIVTSSSFEKPIIEENTFHTAKLDFINSSDPAFKIRDGKLYIGKSGTYQVLLTGTVKKQNDGKVNPTTLTTRINVNGISYANLAGKSSMSAAASHPRFTTFTISAIFDLEKGDKLEIQSAGTKISEDSPLTISSPFTLMLMFLN